MPNFDAWLGYTGALAEGQTEKERTRAALAWRRINDKPTQVAFRTPAGATLAAQTVRIESDDRASAATSDAGTGASRYVVIFGVRNHASVPDTDVAQGYRFNWANEAYRVTDLILTLGEVQAMAEATG